ncbi:hypothetical protein J6590_005034 [Homalodisca vitripennis]|nr:hypothetical protein J6590_005034 [Homalodisca vitripennis]
MQRSVSLSFAATPTPTPQVIKISSTEMSWWKREGPLMALCYEFLMFALNVRETFRNTVTKQGILNSYVGRDKYGTVKPRKGSGRPQRYVRHK